LQNWPYIRNEASTNQNPYWIQYKNLQNYFKNRTLLQFKAKFDFTSWLNLQARSTINLNNNRNNLKDYAGTDPVTAGSAGALSGIYNTAVANSRSIYADFLLNAAGDVSQNFHLEGTLGFSNTQGHSYNLSMGANGNAGMIYPNVFTVTNFVSPASLNGAAQFNYDESEYKQLSQALFGTVTIGFKNTIFLNATARNEWSYTSPKSFFYPSVGLSYVLTNTTGSSDAISYAKIRASYAQVGSPLPRGANDRTPPYSINTGTSAVNTGRTLPYFSGTDTTTLTPERTNSFEAGIELGFIKNKLDVKLTYYDATTKNQVFTIAAPSGSGAANFYINGGSIRNFGIEGEISYAADLGKVHWNTSLNFSHNVNQIRKLSDKLGTNRFQIQSSGNSRLVASFLYRPGEGGGKYYGSFGDYYGRIIVRDSTSGSVVLNDKGVPELTSRDESYVGNPNPHFLAGFNNTFNYKGFSLSFLIDGRFGGYVYSLTQAWLDFKGLSKRTAKARDNGGVMVNGNKIPAYDYFQQISGGGNYPAIYQYRYSATNIRLRDLSIGYTFSHIADFLDNIKISLIGRNLLFFYKDAPFDPEKSMNPGSSVQGLEVFGMPATRSYGFSIDINF
jgi:outer membrane receptor protein involved in Fe transport